jgi:L-galactose dehydrogenase
LRAGSTEEVGVDTVVFGRTGLEVSVAGLGCGGHSRLGQSYGASANDSVRLVRRALDLGVTYVDTARAYGTEPIVGDALRGRRDQVLLSTKVSPSTGTGTLLDAAGLRDAVQASLSSLQTDWIDVYHLHGVGDNEYGYCVAELVPELERLRDAGTIRFLAISERFAMDPGHTMLQRAVQDDCWDVMMVGFNALNQSARARVLPVTQEKDIAVEVMFAVRRVLSRPDELARVVGELAEQGRIDGSTIDLAEPLEFLVRDGARSVVEAAYRLARHEPGCHVVLTGTGNVEHLATNVRSISAGPLPHADVARLRHLFGHLDHVSGN